MQPAWLKLAPTDYTIAIHSETAVQTQQPWFNKWLSDGGMHGCCAVILVLDP
jgi:hypothetical protein